MRPELIQGDSRESAEVGVFPFIDIDRTYIHVVIIDIRYNNKNSPRRAEAYLNFLVIQNDSRVSDIDPKNFTGS